MAERQKIGEENTPEALYIGPLTTFLRNAVTLQLLPHSTQARVVARALAKIRIIAV